MVQITNMKLGAQFVILQMKNREAVFPIGFLEQLNLVPWCITSNKEQYWASIGEIIDRRLLHPPDKEWPEKSTEKTRSRTSQEQSLVANPKSTPKPPNSSVKSHNLITDFVSP